MKSMFNKMKKIFVLLLIIVLSLSILVGCNKPIDNETLEEDISDSTNSNLSSEKDWDPNNDDLIGEGLGADFGWKPIGYDLDGLVERMGDMSKIKIGVNVNHLQSNWPIMWSEEYKRLAKHYGFELLLLSSDNDPAKDAENIKTFMSQECDVVIFYPANAVSAVPILNAEKEKIKIIHYSTGGDFFGEKVKIINDQYGKGVDIATMVKEDAAGEKRNILLIGPAGDIKYVDDRIEGFNDVCNENPNLKVVKEIRTLNIDDTLNKVKEILLVNDEIDTIAGVITASMLGGYNAAAQLDRIDNMYVYGMDPDESMLDLITEGKIKGMVCQIPQMSSYFSTFLALRVINDDSMESIQQIPKNFDFICRAPQVDQVRKMLFPDSSKSK